MGGRIIVESVAGCSWNGWPDDRGIRKRSILALCDYDCSAVTMHRIQCCALYFCPVMCDCGFLYMYTVVEVLLVPDDLWSLPR
ncbi:Phage- or plasmid-associated DNA primase [Pseudomonas syringae pv. actinidiae]|uniref:Phage-or plasmid-associated DNA primase n=1 Tax=Pseudomonas syringae pv. actinidiae TaxID=103796 RepID=A0A2V0QBR8_PSESF|nr:Phage- or plasmid-associated DNA primase [Pseudomonas syringae pv. actinidiae]